MAGKILEVIAKTLTPEEKDQMIQDNFQSLGKQQYLIGAQILVDLLISVQQVVSATSYTDLTQFKAGVVSSGGMLEVNANIVMYADNVTAVYGLFVDAETVPREEVTFGPSVAARASISLRKSIKLGEGQHVIKLKAKVNGASAIFAETASSTIGKSSFQITEILGG